MLLAAVLSVGPPGLASAAGLAFTVEEIAGEDWRVTGIDVVAASPARGEIAATIRLGAVTLPAGHGELRDLELRCDLEYADELGWRCPDGRLRSAGKPPITPQDAGWRGRFAGADDWQIELFELALGTGRADLRITGGPGGWDARLRAYGLPVASLAAMVPPGMPPGDWDLQGRLSGTVRARGDAGGVTGADAELVADRIAYAEPGGRQAAEGLLLKTDAKLRRGRGGWRFELSARVPQGALYSEPVFVDAAEGPLAVTASGRWREADGLVEFDAWTASLGDAVSLSGTGGITVTGLVARNLTLVARSDEAGRLYQSLLQPFVIGSAVDDLDVSGRVGVVLHLDAEGLEQAGMELSGLTLADRSGRFALRDATGSVAWDRDDAVPLSRVDVGGASLYRIPVDAFSVQVQFFADRLSLGVPVVLPVLDGEVALDAFELRGGLFDGRPAQWRADASVRGVSLAQMTEVLQWPPFNGRIDGRLRDMRYRDGRLGLGGGLELQAFGGSIDVRDLRIDDPLGAVPVLAADATLRGLDLESLTGTFSFGRIEGRLDGDLQGLRLVGWQPDAFDLHLYTPPDDRSRRRISQRAVQNLTELGSGVPGGLSAPLLNAFQDFRYGRIDVRVGLRGDVAEIDGLARDEGGYYLVRGAGLPRIDVIGRNRRVAWKDLIERLRQIRVEGVRIE